MLEVSVKDIVNSLSNYSRDTTFVKALRLAEQNQKNSTDDFITLFAEAWETVDPNGKMAAVFSTIELKDKIDYNSSNADVISVLREESNGAIDNAFNVLRSRIDRFGVTNPNIQQLETAGRILVELPGVNDQERVRKLLQGTANLEFWETYKNSEIYGILAQANEVIREQKAAEEALTATEEPAKKEEVKAETEGNELLAELENKAEEGDSTDIAGQNMEKNFPLFAVLNPNAYQGQLGGGSVIGRAHYRDTAKVGHYLRNAKVKALFPRDMRTMWGVKAIDDAETIFELHAIKVTSRDGRAPLDGSVVTNARQEFGESQASAEVTMVMNAEGAKTWAKLTKANVGRAIAIVLDGYVYSAPNVGGEIAGGRSSISGSFTVEEAKDLANVLKSGKLPAPAHIIEEEIVGPSLGQEAIDSGFKSFMIAFLVVLLYMIFYYSRRGGLVADIALLANMFFMIGVLASFGAVLTLPGIAGIVLTIGMSVDANVLIYERIREELMSGKGVAVAIRDGYKNAYSAIIDANITTFITAFILFIFGTGPIKGFATTLLIGIFTSLFTAIFITRLIFELGLARNWKISFSTKLTEGFFKNTDIKFIAKRKIYYVISGIVIVIGIASLFTRGLNQGVDFTGGRTYVVRYAEAVNTVKLQADLAAVYGSTPEVKVFGDANQVKITTKYRINDDGEDVDADVETKLYEGSKKLLGNGVTKADFMDNYRQSSQKVGPTIADDIKTAAFWAILVALAAIFGYIAFRFRNFRFGLGAIAALVHDVLIVLGIFSIGYSFLPFSLEIDQAFIAAILTVVGYSINDTVVVFDRIREYLGLYPKRDRTEIMNKALNSTLSRTFSTSLSTFVVLLTIFIFGGEVIRGFVFALMVGVVVGTYSSLFIATPVVFDSVRAAENKRVLTGKAKK
jgi:SecD/SecF fusion protein